MEGRGRALNNIFVERLWWSVRYEEVYLKGYATVPEVQLGITKYFALVDKYNRETILNEQ